jgi:hypothetical protein
VLRSAVDRGSVRAEQPPVAVLVRERVDERGELVEAPVHVAPPALQRDPFVDDLRHARRGVTALALVPVTEQRAQRLVLAPVAERVLPRLELARLDALGDGRDAAPELVDVGGRARGGHPLRREEVVEREPLGLDAPDLLGGEVVDRELEIAVDARLRGKAPVRLVVDDLVSAPRDPVHAVDHAGELDALDLDREAELERGGDPVRGRVLAVVQRQDLPSVLAVHPLLGLVGEPVRDPRELEHLVELVERRWNGHRPVVEHVEGPVERVAERERGGGGLRDPVLVLELELGRAGLVGVDR